MGVASEEFGDLDIAIRVWKDTLRYLNYYDCSYFKEFPYKFLVHLYRTKKNYHKSNVYIKKLLKYSWIHKNQEVELYCYENIAKNYFYENNIEEAQFFHDKMVYS